MTNVRCHRLPLRILDHLWLVCFPVFFPYIVKCFAVFFWLDDLGGLADDLLHSIVLTGVHCGPLLRGSWSLHGGVLRFSYQAVVNIKYIYTICLSCQQHRLQYIHHLKITA